MTVTFTTKEKLGEIDRMVKIVRAIEGDFPALKRRADILAAIADDYRKLAAEEALEADIAAEVEKVRAGT